MLAICSFASVSLLVVVVVVLFRLSNVHFDLSLLICVRLLQMTTRDNIE